MQCRIPQAFKGETDINKAIKHTYCGGYQGALCKLWALYGTVEYKGRQRIEF
jgi:hypothetical protein